jgi:hypothetical protein
MWIVIVMGILAMATMALFGRRVADVSNLGYVSERWLSEYRNEQHGDSM